MTDFNPDEVPVRLAATLLLITNRPDLQVLMLKRNTKTVFAGGMWVFPGGAIDPVDTIDNKALIVGGAPPGMPDEADTAVAASVGAIRETFEEAGVLLAYQGDGVNLVTAKTGQNADFNRRLLRAREALNARQPEAFVALLEQESLRIALDRIHFFARWITPPGGPRRFDTRFFIASMPTDQTPLQDNNEATHCRWLSPKQALGRYAAGEMEMMTPTLGVLSAMAAFNDEQEVFGALAKHDALWRVHINMKTRELLMPTDADYEAADETIEFGWMKLPLSDQVPAPKATGSVRRRLKHPTKKPF